MQGERARAKAGVSVRGPARHFKGAVVVGARQVFLEGEALLGLVVGPLAGLGALGAVGGSS